MIYLGLDDTSKSALVQSYCEGHSISKVVVFSPKRFAFRYAQEHQYVDWPDIIKYVVYYPLLREIDDSTLLVVNECLRTQNRNDLTYNCLRNFLNQTRHQIIFQYLPIIDSWDDFGVLFDFATRSRWKRERVTAAMLADVGVTVWRHDPSFNELRVPTTEKLRAQYEKKKQSLIDGIGLKDPHTIPRNLHLVSGPAKADWVKSSGYKKPLVGRNRRLKLPGQCTYQDGTFEKPHTVLEFCHNTIDFCDFLSLSRQREVDVLATDLKVDQWYLTRYREWARSVADAYATLSQ